MKTKIEIGAGLKPEMPHDTWIWQDIQPLPNIDLVWDAAFLPLSDDSINEMYSSHVIEHFLCLDMKDIFLRWYKILKCGGKMIHVLPDFFTLWKLYIEGYDFPNRKEECKKYTPEEYVCLITANGNPPQSHLNHLSDKWYLKTLSEIGFQTTIIKTGKDVDMPCLEINAIKI